MPPRRERLFPDGRTAWTKSVKTSANFAFCGMSRSRRRDGKWRHFARLHIKELLERNLSVSPQLPLPLRGDEIEFPKHVFLLLLFPSVEIPGGHIWGCELLMVWGFRFTWKNTGFQKGVFEDMGCLCEDMWGVWGHMGGMRTYGAVWGLMGSMWGHMGRYEDLRGACEDIWGLKGLLWSHVTQRKDHADASTQSWTCFVSASGFIERTNHSSCCCAASTEGYNFGRCT